MKKDTKINLSRTTRVFHWLIAVIIIVLILMGTYMEENETWALYPIHKSIGILIFIPVLLRVVWRYFNGWPVAVGFVELWQQRLARGTHAVLLTASVLMPVSGMMMSGFGGYGLAVFGFELIAANPDPQAPGKVIAYYEGLSDFAYQLHGALGTVLIIAVALHVFAALKHHFIDQDNVLKRMLGR